MHPNYKSSRGFETVTEREKYSFLAGLDFIVNEIVNDFYNDVIFVSVFANKDTFGRIIDIDCCFNFLHQGKNKITIINEFSRSGSYDWLAFVFQELDEKIKELENVT